MTNFWNDLPKPFFVLAPMEAVTDVVFRHVIASAARPDVFFTEFTNTDSFCSPKGEHSTRSRLAFTDDEKPMVAQIWGNHPDHFQQMADGLANLGYTGIDINMGCPDKAVIKNGAGSALIQNSELARSIIRATKTAGLPVSVKTRLGYSRVEEWQTWLGEILGESPANLTVHLRTKKEMSKVNAHYEIIPDILKLRDEISPQTLVTINGDIRDRRHGLELAQQYQVDGIMIGRGVFHNPYVFSDDYQPNRVDLLRLLELHLNLFDKYSLELEPRKFEPLKRFFKVYLHSFPGASELREQLMRTKSTDEVRQILATCLDDVA